MKRTLSLAALAAAFSTSALAQTPMEPLRIVSGGKTHSFQIELADTLPEITKGLTGRTTLAKDYGLLMDFRTVREQVQLTMKDVKIGLDMLFVDGDGTVRAIAVNARPGSLRNISPGLGSAAVLQIAGGQSIVLGLKPGDKVQNKLFGNGG